MKSASLFALLLALVLFASAQIGHRDPKADTANNLRLLSSGMTMYTLDYDDIFPYAQETKSAFAVMFPYVKSKETFKSYNPGSTLAFNLSVGGVAMGDIDRPASTVMFYDVKAWPDGTHSVSFCDMRAKDLDSTKWAQASKTLKSRFKHKGKPLPKDYYKKLNYRF